MARQQEDPPRCPTCGTDRVQWVHPPAPGARRAIAQCLNHIGAYPCGRQFDCRLDDVEDLPPICVECGCDDTQVLIEPRPGDYFSRGKARCNCCGREFRIKNTLSSLLEDQPRQ